MALDHLPELNFCDTDTSKIESDGIALYEGIARRTLYPGDPERLFVEGLLAVIAQQRAIINHTGKMNTLRYAVDEYLEHKGAMTDTIKLDAFPALTTVSFTIAAPLAFVVTIDKGTQVTPDGKLMFSTIEVVEIGIGETSVSVQVKCDTPGEIGNGFVVGQINRLVGGHDYITSVSNTTTSSGGAEEEDDDRYRDRIQLSPERITTAGPDDAYKFWAMTAHPDIIDVAVYSPSAVSVDVRPLMKGGTMPTAEILTAVAQVLSVRNRRPLTDQVTASAPEVVPYTIDATYYIDSANSTLAAQIKTAVEQSLDAYILWQRSKFGRDINPSELNSRIKAAGAKRIEITQPVFATLEKWQVAAEGTVTLTYGGLEDE